MDTEKLCYVDARTGARKEERMKKHFFIFFSVISLSIIFTTLSCKQNTESGESGGSYPILKISSAYDGYIYSVMPNRNLD